jgi:hypothetical protein
MNTAPSTRLRSVGIYSIPVGIKSEESDQGKNIGAKPEFIPQFRDRFWHRFFGSRRLFQRSLDVFLFFDLFNLSLVVHAWHYPWIKSKPPDFHIERRLGGSSDYFLGLWNIDFIRHLL